MDRADLVRETETFVRECQKNESSGHDWHHTDRVRRMALRIADVEGANRMIVELAALLHDIADHKFHGGDTTVGPQIARDFLISRTTDPDTVNAVCRIVEHLSFKNADTPNLIETLEGRVVQDADRLDAIGAIGIARCFAYGGHRKRPMYDPVAVPESSVGHFYDKLLLLKDRMNTETGRRFAERRHQFLENYVAAFLSEWDGKDLPT